MPDHLLEAIKEWFQFDGAHLDPSMLTKAERVGRCYEMAFRKLLSMENSHMWVLVHGYPRLTSNDANRGRLYGHGWLEMAGHALGTCVVWDPTVDSTYAAPAYYRAGSINPEHCATWTLAEACSEAIIRGSVGCWHEPTDLPETPIFADDGKSSRKKPSRGTQRRVAGPTPGHTPAGRQTVARRKRNP